MDIKLVAIRMFLNSGTSFEDFSKDEIAANKIMILNLFLTSKRGRLL